MTASADLLRFFHPVLPARDLGKKPVRVVIGASRYALWRDASGRPQAVADACPHRAAPLSMGKVGPDGRLACRYHGWNFDGEGAGNCPSQPSLKVATTAYQVVERDRYLWLARKDVPLDRMPPLGWDGYQLAGAFATPMQAPIHIMLDNFTEDEHFPYVHQAFGWAPEDWDKVRYEATLHDDHTTAFYAGPQRPHPIVTALGVKRGDWFHNSFESRFDPIRSVYTSHWESPETGVRRPVSAKTAVFMVPEGERTRFHTFLYLKLAPGSLHEKIRPIVERISLGFVMMEWWMDGRWTKHLADTVPDLKGQRLGKYDKTVIRNRKLLQSVYFGGGDVAREATAKEAS